MSDLGRATGILDATPLTAFSHLQGNQVLCGEVSGDGQVTTLDVARVRSFIAGALTLSSAETSRCPVIGADGFCDVRAPAVLARAVLGLEPVPAQVCPAALP